MRSVSVIALIPSLASDRGAWTCRRLRTAAVRVSASSAACPVSARKTSSSVGRRSPTSASWIPRSSSLRTASVRIAVPSVPTGTLISPVLLSTLPPPGPSPSTAPAASGARSAIGHPQRQHLAADARLQLVRGALGDDPAAVDHGDRVREAVGLLQVLRREQQGGSFGHQLADDVPHLQSAARVEARRRLVQEQDLRAARRGWRPGRAGGACRRSTSWPCGGPRPVSSNRSRSSWPRRFASAAGTWYRRPTISRFSRPVRFSSTAAFWPARPITCRSSSACLTTS